MEELGLEDEGIEVIVGTYEEFVLGYKLSKNENVGDDKEHVSFFDNLI